MKIRSFFKLVEIRVKIASLFPFVIGTTYTLYHFQKFNVKNLFLFLTSLLCFSMFTTGFNNYIDSKKANKKHGYNYESHNAIIRDNLGQIEVLIALFLLLFIAIFFGIILFFQTNIIVLFLGIFSFMVGIFYSFGPISISRTPFGELFSGFFEGFIITFLSIYIHIYDTNIIQFIIDNNFFTLKLNFVEIIYIFLVSLPSAFCIANIMLANNICDIEDDLENKRYTLPIFIGKKYSILIFIILYLLVYIDIAILSITKIFPVLSIITLITLIPVMKNVKIFHNYQSKKETFPLSMKNFILICGVLFFTLTVSLLFNLFR